MSSTVYDFESQLDMVYSTLDGYGYDVMMSHKETIPLDSKLSNLENCLKGVEDCDVFLGRTPNDVRLNARVTEYIATKKVEAVSLSKTICNIGIIRFPIRQQKTTSNRWG